MSSQKQNISLSIADRRGRTKLIAQARWVLLFLTTLYAIVATVGYKFSGQSLHLGATQITLLLVSITAILVYNITYHFFYESIHQRRFVDHFQILLDLLFVTLLVYCSSGSASWLWALYLLVTLEASILLQHKRDIWLLGATGSLLFGGLLLLGYLRIIPHIHMPFVDPELHHNPLYLVLKWLWICLLNAIVALAGTSLMAMVLREREAVETSEKEKVAFMETAHDLIFHCSASGEFLYVNPAWQKALGYTMGELAGKTMLDFISGESKNRCIDEFRRALRGKKASIMEGKLRSRDGTQVTVEGSFSCTFKEGEAQSMWGICRDVTARTEAQEQLHHMAHHDMLTDLPNRLTFHDRLNQAKAMAKRQKNRLAVLFLDLDRFKMINDTLGHAVGDMLLQEVANRLQENIREIDTVSRFGGDEFVILLVNPQAIADIDRIAQQILQNLGRPMMIDGNELFITTSIGISIYPNDETDAEELIKKADIAMYQAKANGRNNYQFYCPEMDMHAQRRLILETSLRKAIENEEFYLLYQPKVSLQSNQITAFEALVRWQHPTLGIIPPTDFITLAEESGLIVSLGEWVLREACRQCQQWHQEQQVPIRVAVNLSGFQLERKDFVLRVKSILAETGLAGKFLEFEITESVIMQNPDFAVDILNQLRDMGVHISIDDFGTGYSSLAHLKRFSVNTLKIDKSFVSEVDLNGTDAAIATAIIAMGKSLNLSIIAEGVETEGQREFLKKEACNEMQGYLFSKPVPPEQVLELLKQKPLHGDGKTSADQDSARNNANI